VLQALASPALSGPYVSDQLAGVVVVDVGIAPLCEKNSPQMVLNSNGIELKDEGLRGLLFRLQSHRVVADRPMPKRESPKLRRSKAPTG